MTEAVETAPAAARAEANAPAPAAPDETGWRAVLRDAFPSNPHGVVPITWGLARAPFETIFRLVADPTYRSYWGHLLGFTGATAVALYVTLPEIFNRLVGQNLVGVADADQQFRLKMQMIQITAFLLLTPLQYYVCKWVSPVSQPPRAYFKLCALSICFGLLIRIALGVVAVLSGLVIFYGRLPIYPSTVIRLEFLVGTLVIIGVVTALHRRFWQLSVWKALALTLLFTVATVLVLSPILYQVVQAFDQLDQFKPKRR